MGFFDKIKKLLKNKKEDISAEAEKKETILKMTELKPWIDKKIEENNALIEKNNEDFLNQLALSINRLDEKKSVLENLDISKKKEIEKVKLVVEENRKTYIIFLENLIDNLRNPKKELGFKDLLTQVQTELNKFSERTAKNRMKANFLIGKEIEDIIIELKNIMKLCDEFYGKNLSNFNKKDNLLAIEKSTSEILEKTSNKDMISKQLNEKISEKNKIINEESELIKNLESIKKGEEFSEYIRLEDEIESASNLIKNNSKKINQSINQKAIERYLHEIGKDKVAEKYLNNPVIMILEDEELKISGILKNSFNIIQSDETIDKKKKGRMLASIFFDREFFENLRNDRISLIEKSEKLKEELKAKKEALNLEKIDGKIENYKRRKEELESEIKESKKIFENEEKRIFELAEKIENKMNDVSSNEEIKINY